jgi:hypothetical protein
MSDSEEHYDSLLDGEKIIPDKEQKIARKKKIEII